MTEPAPSQGERTISERECAEVKIDGKLISDIEFEVGMGTGAWDQVEPEELIAAVLKCCSAVPKSALDAERAQCNKLRLSWQELADKATKIADAKFDMGMKIAKLEQQLAAERARADAMRAAIAGTIKVEDVPGARMSSLLCFLEGIAKSGNLFIERSMAELYAKHLRAAIAIGENQPERSEP